MCGGGGHAAAAAVASGGGTRRRASCLNRQERQHVYSFLVILRTWQAHWHGAPLQLGDSGRPRHRRSSPLRLSSPSTRLRGSISELQSDRPQGCSSLSAAQRTVPAQSAAAI